MGVAYKRAVSEAAAPTFRLAALVTEAEAAYAEIKRVAEASVVRSEWTSGPRYADEPAHFEIQKMRRGQRLAQRPLDPTRTRQYGFDAEGRVVVERQPVEINGQWSAYETFSRHEPDGIARFHYDYSPKKRFLNCSWVHHGPLGVDSVHTAYANGRGQLATYRYGADERVETVELRRSIPGGEDTVEHRDLSYDEAGLVTRVIWRTAKGETHVDFERPAEADRLLAAQPRLVEGLADAIVAALANAQLDGPLAAIVLQTSGGAYQHRFPPIVAVATENTLQRARAALGPEQLASSWSPAEWEESELAVSLGEGLAALCASVSQDVWQNDLQAQADHALLRLTAAIEARDLQVPRADPFVVVVVEVDGAEDAGTQVAGQIGKETREKLRGRGWL